MKYKIVEAKTPIELEGLVQKWLDKGWKLVGCVFVYTTYEQGPNYIQLKTETLCREMVLEKCGLELA